MLVEVGGRYVNTDHFVSIDQTNTSGPEARFMATLSNGKTFSFTRSTASPDDMCGTVVPAYPGLTLVEAFLADPRCPEEQTVFRMTPVVAFRVTGPGQAPMPIGLFGEPRGFEDAPWAVMSSCGQCTDWERVWDSLDDFKEECRDRATLDRSAA